MISEKFGVPGGDFLFFCKECRELFELGDTNCGEEIDEAVVVADFIVDEFYGLDFCGGGEVFCPLGKCGVVGSDHSATAGGDEFVTVKAKGGHIAD